MKSNLELARECGATGGRTLVIDESSLDDFAARIRSLAMEEAAKLCAAHTVINPMKGPRRLEPFHAESGFQHEGQVYAEAIRRAGGAG